MYRQCHHLTPSYLCFELELGKSNRKFKFGEREREREIGEVKFVEEEGQLEENAVAVGGS